MLNFISIVGLTIILLSLVATYAIDPGRSLPRNSRGKLLF